MLSFYFPSIPKDDLLLMSGSAHKWSCLIWQTSFCSISNANFSVLVDLMMKFWEVCSFLILYNLSLS